MLSHTRAGVVVASSGSRITTRGDEVPENEYFRPSASFVAPAEEENSPPESVVGMQITGITEVSRPVGVKSELSSEGVVAEFATACSVDVNYLL